MKNYIPILGLFLLLFSCDADFSFGRDESSNSVTGQGGSLARFTIIGDYLYIVNGNDLQAFELNDSGTKQVSVLPLNNFAETIFPFKNKLLIGTRTGMLIYGLDNPRQPNFISQYSHFVSCDPVVAQDNHAYVTLRSGTPCIRGQNQLDVLDISNITFPKLESSVEMSNPYGLAVRGDRLYVCEGNRGLAVFDISNPKELDQVDYQTDIKAFDVIASGNRLIATGEASISQFGLGENDEIKLLSKINLGE